ncbi:hypothetical protein IAT40_002463 [Kwoniella sp. CBS 6097]
MSKDRTKARPLTLSELWACWDPMIGEPWKEMLLVSGSLGSSGLPREAKDVVPSEYPVLRTDYTLQSTERLLALQNQRRLRLLVIRDVFIKYPPGRFNSIPLVVREVAFVKVWTTMHEDFAKEVPLAFKLLCAQNRKEQGNSQNREGKWQDALSSYAQAWMMLLPYHLDAFQPGDPRRLKLAAMESTLLNNIMATVIEMTKEPKFQTLDNHEKLDLAVLGWRAGVFGLQLHFAMTVGTLKRAYEYAGRPTSVLTSTFPVRYPRIIQPQLNTRCSTVRRHGFLRSIITPLDDKFNDDVDSDDITVFLDDLVKDMPDRRPLLFMDYKGPEEPEDVADMVDKYLNI